MPAVDPEETLEAQRERLEEQIRATERQLQTLKANLLTVNQELRNGSHAGSSLSNGAASRSEKRLLQGDEYKRYGRQLIMPKMGLQGQLRLKQAKVLIVGVGGLGCPAAMYLAGAGVGTLGLMDGDVVELSNLHRQIAHSTDRVGLSKVDSAYQSLRALNPLLKYNLHNTHVSPENALAIFDGYDLILDCTDHPTSRYLISDACILTGKPLVSASALKTEGQLIALNDPPRSPGDMSGGPCYRCIFPKPPPAESVLSCGEGGILGPVVGTMGVLQALEAIKLLSRPREEVVSDVMGNGDANEPPRASMLMFSAYNNPQFRTARLRSRRSNCAVCSSTPTITKDSLNSGSLDYIAFCGVTTPVNILPPPLRLSPTDFATLPNAAKGTLIDVRDETQFAICAVPESVNVPWTGNAASWLTHAEKAGVLDAEDSAYKYIVCRFGNDSQLAAKAIIDRSGGAAEKVKDIKGGFQSWREEVDPEWPDY